MSYETILFEKTDNIVRITLNRPEKLNALSTKLRRELILAGVKLSRRGITGFLVQAECLSPADTATPVARLIFLNGGLKVMPEIIFLVVAQRGQSHREPGGDATFRRVLKSRKIRIVGRSRSPFVWQVRVESQCVFGEGKRLRQERFDGSSTSWVTADFAT